MASLERLPAGSVSAVSRLNPLIFNHGLLNALPARGSIFSVLRHVRGDFLTRTVKYPPPFFRESRVSTFPRRMTVSPPALSVHTGLKYFPVRDCNCFTPAIVSSARYAAGNDSAPGAGYNIKQNAPAQNSVCTGAFPPLFYFTERAYSPDCGNIRCVPSASRP